jgi:hypothetical protein
MILTGQNLRTLRNTCTSAALSTTNPTWADLGANPALRGEKPVTNRLSYDMNFTPELLMLPGCISGGGRRGSQEICLQAYF